MNENSIPAEEGWYVARRKKRPVSEGSGWKVVYVQFRGTAGPIAVWQHADDREWPVEQWEFRERIWPFATGTVVGPVIGRAEAS
jgi:hypothetical protein